MSAIVVAGNTSGSVTLDAPDAAGTTVITLPSTSGTMVATDASGNVGLGVTPSAWDSSFKAIQMPNGASFAGYSGVNDVSVFVLSNANYSSGVYKYVVNDFASLYQQYNGAHQWHTAPSGTAGNTISFTQAMTLDASGNLLVGTTSVIDLGKIGILFGGSTQNGIAIKPSDATANAGYIVFDNNSGTRIGSIIRNGATNAVLYNTTSDYRLKEQVAPLTNALDKVTALKPVSWVWKDCDGALGQGFIAHEVQEVIPSAVSGEKDAVYEDGSIKPQGMDASYLVATLTAAIQELNAKFEAYKASHP